MHQEHWQAAEEHERVARAHLTAAEHNEKGLNEERNNGSHYENHQRAAELHDLAAYAHHAAQQHGKQDHETGHEHSRQALEHWQAAQQQTQLSMNRHGIATFWHRETAELAYERWKARGCPALCLPSNYVNGDGTEWWADF